MRDVSKRSAREDIRFCDFWEARIGKLDLELVHDGTLKRGRDELIRRGLSRSTINHYLEVVRRILKLAAESWRDDRLGKTWIETASKISMLPEGAHLSDRRIRPAKLPMPLSWEQQSVLLALLPEHLSAACEFAALTGMREREVTSLRWAWLRHDAPGGLMYVALPDTRTKSGRNEVVPLSSRARELVEEQRGRHRTYVWTWWLPHARESKRTYKPTTRLHNSAWRKAWVRAEFPTDGSVGKGVHNLRHTFATRLRSMGVSKETRKLLLRHRDEDLTTHYSHAEWNELFQAVERVCAPPPEQPVLSVVTALESRRS